MFIHSNSTENLGVFDEIPKFSFRVKFSFLRSFYQFEFAQEIL